MSSSPTTVFLYLALLSQITAAIENTDNNNSNNNTCTTESLPLLSSSSPCAYGFTVYSPSGGSEGVDFRSHFAVYAAMHNRYVTGAMNASKGCSHRCRRIIVIIHMN
jgi:hypothetical protein